MLLIAVLVIVWCGAASLALGLCVVAGNQLRELEDHVLGSSFGPLVNDGPEHADGLAVVGEPSGTSFRSRPHAARP